ncbi:MAG: DUF262 domain-containing protein [Desulfovibrionaceae bacterium]|nr:DUF262 domain-containing protein [Desulfovibrionaceae bacterium]
MSLQDEIEDARKVIKTDHYPMSIGEWVSMYKEKELDIHPEFQRYYRWTDQQKTNLIESLILGIPIPPIFVSQRGNGVWDVIDGLQRLSTIFQLMGILKNSDGDCLPRLTLENTKYLPSLSRWKWTEEGEEGDSDLNNTLKLIIKRSKLNVSIVLMESNKDVKYELFQRLNTGGSSLSDQEVRNCILVMLNPQMHQWLKELSMHESFKDTISLSDIPLSEKYDMDLALRFIIFYNIDLDELRGVGDINMFITEKMRTIATNPDYDFDAAGDCFRRTFDALQQALDGESLRRFSIAKGKFIGGFLLSTYEVVALGAGFNINNNNDNITLGKMKSLFQNAEYSRWSGSGITATRRLPHLIPLGRSLFSR